MVAYNPATEITADGSTPELPEGDRHHDELSNTDRRNLGADTSAPVRDDVPQPFGWSSASETQASDADADPAQGEPLSVRADSEPSADEPSDGPADEPEPAPRRRGRPRKA